MNNKLSLNCSGTEKQEGGEGGMARRVEWGGLQKGRGHLIVSDGQKGGRAWKIPEQGGWYGGGRGRKRCTCDNEGRQWTGQSASHEQQMQQQPSKL